MEPGPLQDYFPGNFIYFIWITFIWLKYSIKFYLFSLEIQMVEVPAKAPSIEMKRLEK